MLTRPEPTLRTILLLALLGCSASPSEEEAPSHTSPDSGATATASADAPEVTPNEGRSSRDGCDCGSIDPASPCLGTRIAHTAETTGLPPSTIAFEVRCDGGACACGRFGNGHDFWVAPRRAGGVVEVVKMTPETVGDANASLRHGWVANPSATVTDSFMDGRLGGGAHTGVPLRPTPADPVRVDTSAQPVTTIVKSHSTVEPGQDNGECRVAGNEPADKISRHCFWHAEILTVLGAVPPGAGGEVLRPPMTGPEKPLVPISAIDFAGLPNLPSPKRPDGTVVEGPSFADAARLMAPPKVEWGSSGDWPYWQGMPPLYNYSRSLSGYAPRMFAPLYDAMQLLLVDAAGHEDEKRKLAISTVQWGVDLYFMWKARGFGPMFRPNGGHAVGRYASPVVAAALLEGPLGEQMRSDILRVNQDSPARCGFDITGELSYWPDTKRTLYGYTNVPGCSGYTDFTRQTNSCVVDPAHGGDNGRLAVNAFNSEAAVSSCYGAYQPITVGPTLSAANLLRAIPRARALAYSELIPYATRVFDEGAHCRPDQGGGREPLFGRCAGGVNAGRVCTPGAQCPGSTCVGHNHQYGSNLAMNLWDVYRDCYDSQTCPGMKR